MKPIYTFVSIFLLLNIGKSQMKHAEIVALANYPGALLQDLNLKNGDRSFTLQPDTIIISNFENELQNLQGIRLFIRINMFRQFSNGSNFL